MAINYDLNNTGPEVQARLDQVFPNEEAINQETANREEADVTLASRIDDLESVVGEGGTIDERIESKVDSEADERRNADSNLSSRINSLEEAIGTGGSVDERIGEAINNVIGEAGVDYNTLGKIEHKLIEESFRASIAEDGLLQLYRNLVQSGVEPMSEEKWDEISSNPSELSKNIIYRVAGSSSYTDYMYDGENVIPMATYDNAIDDIPMPGSSNLVKSGGVYSALAPIADAVTDETITQLAPYDTVTGYRIRSNSGTSETDLSDTSVSALAGMSIEKFAVTAGHTYLFSAVVPSVSNFWVIFWLDSGGNFIKRQYKGTINQTDVWTDTPLIAPEGAAELWMNVQDSVISDTSVKSVTGNIIDVADLKNDVDGIQEDLATLTLQVEENTANIENLVDAMSESNTPLTPYSTVTGTFINASYDLVANEIMSIRKYHITEESYYLISTIVPVGSNYWVVFWRDSGGNFIGKQLQGTIDEENVWTDEQLIPPTGAVEMWMNIHDTYASSSSVSRFGLVDVAQLASDTAANTSDIEVLQDKMDEVFDAMQKDEVTPLTPYATEPGVFINSSYVEVANVSMSVRKYHITEGADYLISAIVPENSSFWVVFWLDSGGNFIDKQLKGTIDEVDTFTDERLTPPALAAELWMNVHNDYTSYAAVKRSETELVNVVELEEDVKKLGVGDKLMKVVVYNLEPTEAEFMPFYIRTSYNGSKDIILTHRINKNLLLTFNSAYVGDKALTDSELMQSAYLVSAHSDSTAPLLYVTQYWHLFAQHGYPVPYFSNLVGMTAADVGALWQDQEGRQYYIGNVTTSNVYLLPVITQDAHGHYVRGWHSMATSTAITSLTYVSGGSVGRYTTPISLATYYQEQLRPIMEHSDRTWLADGTKITAAGTYYCDEFKVSETQIGYDPATITDWFGGDDGKPDLTGAEVMAIFTYSFNYRGAQCCVNTTIDIRREVECAGYGAIQQQFFLDKGNYKAMVMLPKAAAQNDVELDKPFNSPSSASPQYNIYRTAAYLKDVNDPVDRQVAFLHNPDTGDYLFGMAAGLSLVSGDTVKSKRTQDCLIGDANVHYRLCNMLPTDANKFYIMAFNTSQFAEDDYYLQPMFFREVNYYVSYFDPAENTGQVYWYKDGSQYVIYCHCQTTEARLAINVPPFMEGLSLSVVEKTDGATLLTSTIQNGKFFVDYATDDANYIVLTAK